jgi:hypothetical protein
MPKERKVSICRSRLSPMQERLLKSYNTLYEKNPYGYLITTIAKSLKVSRQCIGEALNTIRDKG